MCGYAKFSGIAVSVSVLFLSGENLTIDKFGLLNYDNFSLYVLTFTGDKKKLRTLILYLFFYNIK